MNAQKSRFLLPVAALILPLLLLTAPGLAKDKKKKKKARADAAHIGEPQTLEYRGNERTYYRYVPEGITEQDPAPLLMLFHGAGRDGTILIEEWKDLADQEKIILAGPEAIDRRYWQIPADGPGFIHAVAEALRKELPVDARRMYVFGHSSGGIMALQMAVLESRYFAASAASAASFQPPDGKTWLRYVKRMIPIFIVSGTQDRFFPLDNVRTTRDALQQAGLPVELWEIEGHDHNYYGRADEINQRVWDFLSGHHLAKEPYYKRFN